MNIFLGDEVTLSKGETLVTGKVTGIVLDDRNELERVYIAGIDSAFWFNLDKWLIVDEGEEEENEF